MLFKAWSCPAATGPAKQWLRSISQLVATLAVYVGQSLKSRAGDHVDYRFENYKEENGRMEVNTHTLLFEADLMKAVGAKGEMVYDGISGATPNGLPPLPGATQVATAAVHDIRRAGNLELDFHIGRQTISPQVAYSRESDYESQSLSLNDAIDFNEKNTTLRLGASHNFDSVLDFPEGNAARAWHNKNSTEGLLGISQLLDPNTIFTADVTYGQESGYLNDPYRNVLFRGWLAFGPNFYIPHREVRPTERTKQVFQTTLTHFFEPVNGSAEISYRFHHDSYGVFSHTVAITWHQRFGEYVILEPLFRYYEQTAADFYAPNGVPGLSPIDGDPTRPADYSADYRLSHFISLTYGVQASVVIKDHLYLDVGYHRYEMYGRDSFTAASAYPKANIFTVGFRLWF